MARKKITSKKGPKAKAKTTKSKKKKSTKAKVNSPLGKPIESQVMTKNEKGQWIGSPQTDVNNPLMNPTLNQKEEPVDPRQKARMERQARKLKQNGDDSNVIPFDVSKRVERKDGSAPNVLDAKMGEVLKVPIPEELKWKLLFLEKERNEAVNRIKEQLKAEYQDKLNKAIINAMNSDKDCIDKTRLQNMCVNEVLDIVDPELPEGYAVSNIMTAEGYAECKYNPNQAGKRVAT